MFEYEHIIHPGKMPFFTYFVNAQRITYHWHKDLELMIVLKGQVLLGVHEEQYVLREGDIFLVNCRQVHFLEKISDENLLLGVQIDSDLDLGIKNSLAKIYFQEMHLRADDIRTVKLGYYMARLMLLLSKNEDSGYVEAAGVLYLLIARLLRLLSYEILDQKTLQLKENDFMRLQSVITYLNAHYSEKITLEDVASMLFISRYHLSHFLKKKLGMGFSEILNHIRLSHALEEIRLTDKTLLRISQECGFSDIKYMNNLIKRHYHMPPSRLRQDSSEGERRLLHDKKTGHGQLELKEAIKILETYYIRLISQEGGFYEDDDIL